MCLLSMESCKFENNIEKFLNIVYFYSNHNFNVSNLGYEFNLSLGIDDGYRDNNFRKIRILIEN